MINIGKYIFFKDTEDFYDSTFPGNAPGNRIVAGALIEPPKSFPAAFVRITPSSIYASNLFIQEELKEAVYQCILFCNEKKRRIDDDICKLEDLIRGDNK